MYVSVNSFCLAKWLISSHLMWGNAWWLGRVRGSPFLTDSFIGLLKYIDAINVYRVVSSPLQCSMEANVIDDIHDVCAYLESG